MARNEDNLYTRGYSGAVGNQKLFAQAVEYAQSVLRDPVKAEAYRKKMKA